MEYPPSKSTRFANLTPLAAAFVSIVLMLSIGYGLISYPFNPPGVADDPNNIEDLRCYRGELGEFMLARDTTRREETNFAAGVMQPAAFSTGGYHCLLG